MVGPNRRAQLRGQISHVQRMQPRVPRVRPPPRHRSPRPPLVASSLTLRSRRVAPYPHRPFPPQTSHRTSRSKKFEKKNNPPKPSNAPPHHPRLPPHPPTGGPHSTMADMSACVRRYTQQQHIHAPPSLLIYYLEEEESTSRLLPWIQIENFSPPVHTTPHSHGDRGGRVDQGGGLPVW